MNDKTIIRQATVWDAYAIVDMWEEEVSELKIKFMVCNEEEKQRFFISLIKKLQNCLYKILVAECKNKIIGFVMGNVRSDEYGNPNRIGLCEHIYLKPEYRNNYTFKKMLTKLMAYSKIIGIQQVQFYTKYDKKIIKFYERLGYEPVQVLFGKEA